MAHRPFVSKVASVIGHKIRQLLLEPRDRLRKTIASQFSEEIPNIPLREFADSGYHIFRSFCDETEIDRLKSRYLNQRCGAYESNDGNVSMPFFDIAFIKRFYESDTWRLLSMYGQVVYGSEPVLQVYPSIIITKPTFSQEEFSGRKHKVPALFHTDYPTELTVHIPLTDVTSDTNHTRFCNRSHRALRVQANRSYSETRANQYDQVHLLAEAGDLIAIDVTGIHRADVVRDSLRIMIQLKFTSPRYVLRGLDWSKPASRARESKVFTQSSMIIKEDLQGSFLFENARLVDRSIVRFYMENY
jgi:hypothetical protein